MTAHPARELLAALGSVASLVALAGCASAAPATGETDASSALLPAGEGTTSYPLTLETPFGDTELEARPERIAIVTDATVDTDALFALGGTPEFAPSTVDRNPWLDDEQIASIDTLWESSAGADISAEEVAASEPDLIVNLAANTTFDQGRFDQLSAIAPVLYAETGELTWQEITTTLADTIDLGEAGAQAVAETEAVIQEAAEAHPEFEGKTAAHVVVYDEEWGAAYDSTPGSDTATLFEMLSFTLPEAAEQFASDDVVSDELIGEIDADFLLVSIFDEPSSEFFTTSQLYQQVPAVADGRVVINDVVDEDETNSFAWGLTQQSVLGLPWLIDTLAEYGSEALS
jgi:iron complex transport system substrate-binding protein